MIKQLKSKGVTVKALREAGIPVFVKHTVVDRYDRELKTLIPTRVTEVTIDNRYTGQSICSHKDQYNRKLGNRIALGRALSLMHKVEQEKVYNMLYNNIIQ